MDRGDVAHPNPFMPPPASKREVGRLEAKLNHRKSEQFPGSIFYFRWIGNSLLAAFSQRRTSTATSLAG
jgi:hypothetical protein